MYPATKDIMAAGGKPAIAPKIQSMVDRMAAKNGASVTPPMGKPATQQPAAQPSPTQAPARPAAAPMDQSTKMGALKRKLSM